MNQKLEAHKCILKLCKLYLNIRLPPPYFTDTVSHLLLKHTLLLREIVLDGFVINL